MHRIRKACTIFIIFILITGIISGCGVKVDVNGSKNTAEEPKKDSGAVVPQEVVVAASSDVGIEQLDAAGYNGLMQVYPMIYDALVEYGEKGEILPSLAESWEISPDEKVYTFHLRKGVKFSDGTLCNADAVKFSIERWANKPDYEWLNVSKNLEKVEVVDTHTIKLHFSTGYYQTLTELSYPRPLRVMSPSSVEPAGDPDGKFVKPIGTGPWKVENYVKEQKAVLVKNTNYWKNEPNLDKLIIKVITDPQTRVLSLQSGEVDLSGGQMGNIPLESLSVLEKDSNTKVQSTESTVSYFLVFNTNEEIFNDVKVRKAINYGINKKSIVDNLFNGIGSPAKGLFQFTVPYVTKDNNKGYEYDINKAKQLLEEAGWADTDGDKILDKDGKALKIPLVLQVDEFPEWKGICEAIQADLFNIGIEVELKMLERAAYYDALWKNKEYSLLIYRTYSDGWNPYAFLTSLFHSKDDQPAVAYGTKELDSLLDQVPSASNDEERQKIYDSIFKLMHDEVMCAPIYYPNEVFVTNTRIEGFEFGPTTYGPVIWEKIRVKK